MKKNTNATTTTTAAKRNNPCTTVAALEKGAKAAAARKAKADTLATGITEAEAATAAANQQRLEAMAAKQKAEAEAAKAEAEAIAEFKAAAEARNKARTNFEATLVNVMSLRDVKPLTALDLSAHHCKQLLNTFGMAYESKYKIAKTINEHSSLINASAKLIRNYKDNLLNDTCIDRQLERSNLEREQKHYEQLLAERDRLLEIQQHNIDEALKLFNDGALYNAYADFIDNRDEKSFKKYAVAYLKAINLAGYEYVNPFDIMPYLTLNDTSNNVLSSEYCSKPLSMKNFKKAMLNRNIDVLIKSGALDTSKYTFTSAKYLKLKENVRKQLELAAKLEK